jgi:polysaccharide transporter, PST family
MTADGSQPDLSRRKTAGWVAVTGGAQAIRFVLTLVSTAVLARLLSPTDFGLIAAASPVLAFTAMLQNLGLNEALVQRPELQKAHVNALFYLMVAFSAVIAASLFLAAPLLATLLSEIRLTGIIQAMAGIALIVALSATPIALMNRRLQFGQLAIIDVAAAVAGLAVGIVFALVTGSYWALVAMQVATAVVQLVGAAFCAKWKPGAASFDREFQTMVGLGAGFSTFNLLNFLSRNADLLLIARFHGPMALGFYERAYKMMLAPLWQSVTPFGRVLTPVLARLQNDAPAYRQRYFESTALLMAAVQPAIVAALMFSDAAVGLVLGPGWGPSSPIFFWLCLTALHQIQTLSLGWLFVSQGRAREFALLGAAGAAIIVSAFVIGLPYGPVGVAMAYAIADITLRAPLTWWAAGRRGPIDLTALVRSFAPHGAAMAVSAAAMVLWSRISSLGDTPTLLGAAVISYFVYGAILWLFPEKRRLIATFARGALKRLQLRAS